MHIEVEEELEKVIIKQSTTLNQFIEVERTET